MISAFLFPSLSRFSPLSILSPDCIPGANPRVVRSRGCANEQRERDPPRENCLPGARLPACLPDRRVGSVGRRPLPACLPSCLPPCPPPAPASVRPFRSPLRSIRSLLSRPLSRPLSPLQVFVECNASRERNLGRVRSFSRRPKAAVTTTTAAAATTTTYCWARNLGKWR